MQWTSPADKARAAEKILHARKWHTIFAYLPVKTRCGTWVWWEEIMVKYTYKTEMSYSDDEDDDIQVLVPKYAFACDVENRRKDKRRNHTLTSKEIGAL